MLQTRATEWVRALQATLQLWWTEREAYYHLQANLSLVHLTLQSFCYALATHKTSYVKNNAKKLIEPELCQRGGYTTYSAEQRCGQVHLRL